MLGFIFPQNIAYLLVGYPDLGILAIFINFLVTGTKSNNSSCTFQTIL